MSEAMSQGQSYREMPKDPEWFTKGYRALASYYHPDNKKTGNAQKMIEINNAHDEKDKITILNELKELKRILDQKENSETYNKIKRAETKPEWEIIPGKDLLEEIPEIEDDDFSFIEMIDEERQKEDKLSMIEKAIDDLVLAEEKRRLLEKQKVELENLANNLGLKNDEEQIVADYDFAQDKYIKALNELSMLTKKSREQIEEEYLK